MRKIVFALVVFMVAVPAMADVDITCVADGNLVTVSFVNNDAENHVRAFALDITVDDGAVIGPLCDYNPDYYIYPGSIDINETTGVVDSYGSPIGDPCDYPDDTLPGVDSNGVTIEMGSLYVGDGNAPDDSGVLFTFTVDKDCNVTIDENEIRGGVVMEDRVPPVLNLPSGCVVTAAPPCWGYDCFCCGDSNGDCFITAVDLMVLFNSWPPKPYDPCADWSKDGFITAIDLMILFNHWPPKEACPEGEGCGPCTPI